MSRSRKFFWASVGALVVAVGMMLLGAVLRLHPDTYGMVSLAAVALVGPLCPILLIFAVVYKVKEAATSAVEAGVRRAQTAPARAAAPATEPDLVEDGETKIHVRTADGSQRSYTLRSVDPAKVAQACAKLRSQGLQVLETKRA